MDHFSERVGNIQLAIRAKDKNIFEEKLDAVISGDISSAQRNELTRRMIDALEAYAADHPAADNAGIYQAVCDAIVHKIKPTDEILYIRAANIDIRRDIASDSARSMLDYYEQIMEERGQEVDYGMHLQMAQWCLTRATSLNLNGYKNNAENRENAIACFKEAEIRMDMVLQGSLHDEPKAQAGLWAMQAMILYKHALIYDNVDKTNYLSQAVHAAKEAVKTDPAKKIGVGLLITALNAKGDTVQAEFLQAALLGSGKKTMQNREVLEIVADIGGMGRDERWWNAHLDIQPVKPSPKKEPEVLNSIPGIKQSVGGSATGAFVMEGWGGYSAPHTSLSASPPEPVDNQISNNTAPDVGPSDPPCDTEPG